MFVLVGRFVPTDALDNATDVDVDALQPGALVAYGFPNERAAEAWPGLPWFPHASILEVQDPPRGRRRLT